MFVVFLALMLVASPVLSQGTCPRRCHDVEPDNSGLPCSYYTALNQCDDDIMKNDDGVFAYCFCSCGRCTPNVRRADVPPEPTPRDLFAVSGNAAVITGTAFSTSELVTEVSQAITDATVILDTVREETDPNAKTDAIVGAAEGTAESVATSIATAFAATEIRAITTGDNSQARGVAEARAESIANATARAYATALAQAGDESVFLEAETLETDIKTALVNSYAEVDISGNAEARVVNEAISTAVAEVVATATARAFARYADGDSQAVAQALTTATQSDDIGCPTACNDGPPDADFTCEQQKEWGKCNQGFLAGFCECVCGTCSVGAEATTTTTIELGAGENGDAFGGAQGDATGEGIAGADASASAIVSAAASGNAQAVVDAVSAAFAGGEAASAVADAIAEAIGDGSGTVTTAVAEAFALAEGGGYADALAASIVYAFTEGQQNVAAAYGEAISAAIATGGCEAVASALSQAEAIAEGDGKGEAFADALSNAEAINDCIISGPATAAIADADSVAQATVDTGCPSSCNDSPPDNLYSCEDQKGWGKCTEPYMQGFCECTCDKCVA